MEGLGGIERSAKEAAIGISVDHMKRRTKAPVNFARLVRMPPQVTAHPVQLPSPMGPEEADSSHWSVPCGRLVVPLRPDFEDLHDMADD